MNDDAIARERRKAVDDDRSLVTPPAARRATSAPPAPRSLGKPAFVAPLAAAALVALYIAVRPLPEEALSLYTIEFSSKPLQRKGRFELIAQPTTRSNAPMGAKAYLVRDGVARGWAAPTEIDRSGSVRIAGPVGAWFPAAGDYDVMVAIGPLEMLPGDGEGQALARGKVMPHVRVVRSHVVVFE